MTTLLHIDTSGDTGTVFCTMDGQITATVENTATRDHAAAINLMIAEVLEKAGSSLPVVDAIVVCAGPGSYTGLRIGLATAKGLCYATGAKLMLHQKLFLITYQLRGCWPLYTQYAAILPARQGEYFLAATDKEDNVTYEPAHVSQELLDTFLQTLTVDTGVSVDEGFPVPEKNSSSLGFFQENHVRLDFWAQYAFAQFKQGHFNDLANSQPFYMKQPFVTQSKKGLP